MGRYRWISCLVLSLAALGYCNEISASLGRRPWVVKPPWRDTPSCPDLLAQVKLLNHPASERAAKTHARLYFLKSPHPKARYRPVQVLIPGGPGMSYRTLAPLTELSAQFDLAFMDPAGVGEGTYPAFENTTGNQYDYVVQDIAETIHKELEVKQNRDVGLIGFSSGGVLAGEAIARHSNSILSRVKGLVLIAATMTDNSYRSLCNIRETHHLYNNAYQWKKAKVFCDQPERPDFIRSVAQVQWGADPSDEAILQAQVGMSKDDFTQWILAHGSLIYNEKEQDTVEWLVCGDNDTCSPESVLKLIKSWKKDANQGDWTASTLRKQVRTLSIIGGNDRLIPPKYLVEDAEKMQAATLVVDGASHFIFVSDLEKVTEGIYRFYLVPSPEAPAPKAPSP